MTITGWLQIALFSVIVILITRPFGGYMTRVFAGERTFLSPVLRPVERAVYWCCGVDEKEEQHWLTYAVAMLFFSVVGFLTLYALQRLQWYLPFNPQGQTGVEQSLAFNTSVSFVTQHELAVLRAGNHDGLPRADGRADGAQLRFGGDRHRAGAGADPRLRAARGQGDRQFLGRSDPHARSTCCCRCRSWSACSASGRACRRISAPMSTRRRSRAPSRRSPRARSPRRR